MNMQERTIKIIVEWFEVKPEGVVAAADSLDNVELVVAFEDKRGIKLP